MALSNIGREPRREIIEQVMGVIFVASYVGWVVFSVRLSTLIYDPSSCIPYTDGSCRGWRTGYWADPGDFFITLGLSVAPLFIYPALLLMHTLGEMVCGWMRALGFDPRPTQRYR